MLPIVNVFTTSPALRETFAVLLEHDCHVEFLRNATAAVHAPAPAVALVATDAPAAISAQINRLWPDVPVVSIDGPSTLPATARHARHGVIPFDPHAIRGAILRHLRTRDTGELRRCADAIGTALRGDWRPRLQRIRDGAMAANDMPVLIEGSDVLRQFADRPRQASSSGQFLEKLGHALCDRLKTAGIAMVQGVDGTATTVVGPLDLADTVASLLASGIRSRIAEPVLTHVFARGQLHFAFSRRPRSRTDDLPLAFVLAGLALDPCSWRVLVRSGGTMEEIILCPRGTTTSLPDR